MLSSASSADNIQLLSASAAWGYHCTADDGSFQSLKIRLLHIKEFQTRVFSSLLQISTKSHAHHAGPSTIARALAAKRLGRLSTRCIGCPSFHNHDSVLTQHSRLRMSLSFILTASSPGVCKVNQWASQHFWQTQLSGWP